MSMPAMVLSASDTRFNKTADDTFSVSLPHEFALQPISDQKAVHPLPNSAYSSPAVVKKKVMDSSSRGGYMNRSKSCGEGRSSALPNDFDIWQHKDKPPDTLVVPYPNNYKSSETVSGKNDSCKTGAGAKQFKCWAVCLCLFLPGFGKAKAEAKAEAEAERSKEGDNENVISRTVSLEKFECGSWASLSSAMVHEDKESTSLYFDLPMELLRNSVGTQTPVKAGFVFDKIKNGKAKVEKCDADGSARLCKAREEFNALLEAQGA